MKQSAILMALLFMSAHAFAADAENTDSTTVDHSKNPITGTQKIKVKRHVKQKNMGGPNVDAVATETTTVKKNGEVKKEVKVDEKSAE